MTEPETTESVAEAIEVRVQMTPNPNARKFLSRFDTKTEGSANFKEPDDCEHVPLARDLFNVDGVKTVFLRDNYVTISKFDPVPWDEVEDAVIASLQKHLPDHEPTFQEKTGEEKRDRSEMSPELLEIDDILEAEVRPYLAADGGDIEPLHYQDHMLFIRYKGACGSCSISMQGTLAAIQNILRADFDPEIQVVPEQESWGGPAMPWG